MEEAKPGLLPNLDSALNELGMLSTVTFARREYLCEMRKNLNNRYNLNLQYEFSSNKNGVVYPTKENARGEKISQFWTSGPSSRRKSWKSRVTPYEIQPRKSLNTIISSQSEEFEFRESPEEKSVINVLGSNGQEKVLVASPEDLIVMRKTEKRPRVPLSRSKSLEDLREVSKSRSGLYFEASTLIRNNSGLVRKRSSDFGNIKSEIDSMSLRIEKLEVA